MSKSKLTGTASDISNSWGSGMKSSVQKIVKGIDAVTENPAQKAIAAIPKMVAGVQAAAASGKIEAGLASVDLNAWKSKTKQKVAERLSGGVDAAMPKRQQFDNYLYGTLNQVLPSIANMPHMNIEDGINKVRALVTYLHDHPYKGK